MRCAWHPKYYGFPWVYEVASWRGQRLQFSDGMCRWCAWRWREELHAGRFNLLPAEPTEPGSPPLVPAWMPRVGVALALTAAVILAARPLDPAIRSRSVANAAKAPAVATVPLTQAALAARTASTVPAPCAHDDRPKIVTAAPTGARARAHRDARPASMVPRARAIPAAAACPKPATALDRAVYALTRACDAPAATITTAVSARPARLVASTLEAP